MIFSKFKNIFKPYSGKKIGDILLASDEIWSDDEGRILLAVRLSDGSPKVFYRSTGTGTPHLNKEGDWIPMNGITIFMERSEIYYIKDPSKVPGGELKRIADKLKSLYDKGGNPIEASEKKSIRLHGLSDLSTYEEIAKFNRWLERIGAVTLYARETGLGLIGVSFDPTPDDVYQLAKDLGY